MSRPIAPSPSGLNVSRKYIMPRGGTCTNRCRPSQKTSVATAMRMPGTPNAQPAPAFWSSHGVSSVEKNEPKLIAK